MSLIKKKVIFKRPIKRKVIQDVSDLCGEAECVVEESSSASSDEESSDVDASGENLIYRIDCEKWEYVGHVVDVPYPFFLINAKHFQEWRSMIPLEFAKILCSKTMYSWRDYANIPAMPIKNSFVHTVKFTQSLQNTFDQYKQVQVKIFNSNSSDQYNLWRSDKHNLWSININKFVCASKQYDKIFIYKCIVIALYLFVEFFKKCFKSITIYIDIDEYDFKRFWHLLESPIKTAIINGATIA